MRFGKSSGILSTAVLILFTALTETNGGLFLRSRTRAMDDEGKSSFVSDLRFFFRACVSGFSDEVGYLSCLSTILKSELSLYTHRNCDLKINICNCV